MAEALSLAEEDEFARVCLYGQPGTGKSTSLAHGAKIDKSGDPDMGKVVIVDAEHRLKAGPLKRLDVPVEKIEPFRDVAYDRITELVWSVKERLHDKPGSVGVFGLDAMDEIVKTMIRQVLDANTGKLVERAKKRHEVPTINQHQIDVDMWGVLTDQLDRTFRLMRDLKCHQMFTSHERRDKDPDGAIVIGPSASPAVQATILGYVDILGHTALIDGTHVASFASGTKYVAKDVFGLLPPLMADPTLDRIVAYIRGEIGPGDDPVQDKFDALQSRQIAGIREGVLSSESGISNPNRPRRSQTA